jgi:hypothetical protein
VIAHLEQQARAELTRVDREIRRLRAELADLEQRRAKLSSDFAVPVTGDGPRIM